MSDKNPTPFVLAEVRHGRLVRVCPVCNEEIVEHTDEDGMVTNSFAEHYETEHAERSEPEKQLLYLLGLQPAKEGSKLPKDTSEMDRIALDQVRKQLSGEGVEWQLVDRVEDLPEGEPTIQAAQVLVAGLGPRASDPPHARQIRWSKRQGEHLVFTPTQEQYANWDQARRRLSDAHFVLLDRNRDELPKFEVDEDAMGTKAAREEEYDKFRERVKPLEDTITKDLDAAGEVASEQFHTGQVEWLGTINDAIAAANISDEEIQAKREWFVGREAEIDRITAKAADKDD